MEDGVVPPRSPRSAALLIVGDEILSGEVQDQNTPFLTRRLWELGIRVDRVVILGDRRSELAAEIRRLAPAHDYLLVTGGMGPTHDDVTRQAVAEALHLPLLPHSVARELLAVDYGERLTVAEAAMAELPEGSNLLRGRQRLAYAFRAANVFVFPGVPLLLQDIFETAADQLLSAPFYKETLWVCGKEGDFSEPLAAIQSAHSAVGIGSYPVFLDGRYRCKLVLRARDPAALAAAARAIEASLRLDTPPPAG
ncbi:MAG TPA: competence/damage-inducible protein A [Gemmatimonadota bacterium]|nr:competence/damage-inducible protein A [Gemmatimonadota bacterium]